jgi:CHAT domain-containing protein
MTPPIDATTALVLFTDEQTAAVEFVVTDERVHLFVLAQGRLTHYAQAITRKDLATRVSLALDPAALANREAWRGPSHDLSELLLAPAGDAITAARLVIVIPDGVLWRVPFEALDVPAPSTAAPDAAGAPAALIERAAVVYATSLTTWQYAREAAGARQETAAESPELLAFGGAAAEEELNAVAAAYGAGRSAVHLADEASEPHARAESAIYPVLHFASPGAIDNASPLYSFVRLGAAELPASAEASAGPRGFARGGKFGPAKESESEDDGALDAWEILGLDVRADLAVCSAVEWPAGTLTGAEGITGLSWAWLAAGTPAVVVSRWAVPAPARQILLAAFHQHARDDAASPAGRARALRSAILEVLRAPATEAPLNWAGFMMVGNPD